LLMRKPLELTIVLIILAMPIAVFAWPAQSDQLGNVRVITVLGINNFVDDLNKNGKLGYRLEKSLSYGGEGPTQNYAAVLRLDAPNKYEYDWMSSPDKKLLEGRLNFQSQKGFNFANAYALTNCTSGSTEDEPNPTYPGSTVLRLHKGDAFLLERRNGATERTREYRVIISKVRLGDSAEKTIQAGLENAASQGFRPVKILFARQGLIDFSVSVLTERDSSNKDAAKTEYRFLKKSSGLPDDINKLAAQGFRFVTGRRVGMIGMVLMEKRGSEGTTYTMIDRKKYAKEFDKTVALGNSYQALMIGDLTCDSTDALNERLVFAQNPADQKREYQIKNISFNRLGEAEPEWMNEFKRLVSDGYQIKDLFYFGGVNVIFEK